MKKLLDLTIIIPTRNRSQMLRQAIASVCAGNGIPKQIIVVDQSDIPIYDTEFLDIVDKGAELEFVYLEKPSLTAARNIGIRNARHDIILFMDDDVLLDKHSLIYLCRDFEDGRTALVAAPNAGNVPAVKRYPNLFGIMFQCKKPFRKGGYVCKGAVLGRYPDRLEGAVHTEWAMGYFFAVRHDLVKEFCTGFDEKLVSYAYPEDLDFSYSFIKRACKEGYKAILDPAIHVNHLGSNEWRIPSQKASYMYVIHRYYVSYKYFRSGFMRLMLIWADVGEFLRRLVERERPLDILKAHIMCIRKLRLLRQGVIDGELQNMIR